MKLSKIFLMIFSISFLLGIGLMAITPNTAQAGTVPRPLPDLCDISCYEFSCYSHSNCSGIGTEKMHQKCYGNAMLAEPCALPLSCGCIDIGCGPICNIE